MIDKLIEKIQKTGAPIVVGLDPTMKFVPEHIQKAAFAEKERRSKAQRRQCGFSTRES